MSVLDALTNTFIITSLVIAIAGWGPNYLTSFNLPRFTADVPSQWIFTLLGSTFEPAYNMHCSLGGIK